MTQRDKARPFALQQLVNSTRYTIARGLLQRKDKLTAPLPQWPHQRAGYFRGSGLGDGRGFPELLEAPLRVQAQHADAAEFERGKLHK